MKALSYNIPFIAGKSLKLALFSDLHLDSPDCDLESLRSHLNGCKKEGRFILMGGDEFDAIIHSDKKRYTPSRGNSRDDQINQKLEEAIELLKPMADNILFIGRGNHEESILKYSGVDMIDLLVKELNHYKKNGEIQKGNYQNFIRFNWVKSYKGPNIKTVQHYDILQHHGCGSSAVAITKGTIDFNRLLHGVNADLVWISHKHCSSILPSDPLMYIDSKGEVKMKNRQAILTPSYLKGKTIDDHNVLFPEKFYTHQALPGYGSVDLTPYYENENPRIKTNISLQINPSSIVGKLLQIKLKEGLQK